MVKCSPIQAYRQKFQIFHMAVFDWIAVIFATWVLSQSSYKDYSPIRIFLLLTLLGVVTHFVLKVPTMLGYYLGLNEDPRPTRPQCD